MGQVLNKWEVARGRENLNGNKRLLESISGEIGGVKAEKAWGKTSMPLSPISMKMKHLPGVKEVCERLAAVGILSTAYGRGEK